MPELPEVETTRRGLQPHALQRRILAVVARERRLRWPVEDAVLREPVAQRIVALERRGKYLLLQLERGCLIWHLGMSGSLRIAAHDEPAAAHDHIDLELDDGRRIRFRDPRRFGALLWTTGDPLHHPLLANLGMEPLAANFDGNALYALTRSRRPIKTVLMDSHRVCGIGNIYANEALFHARIAPDLPAESLSLQLANRLAGAISDTLQRAIAAGGSSLRDFVGADSQPGYFQQEYAVYGRTGLPCRRCGTPVVQHRQAQRSTFFCPACQKS